MFRVRVPPLRLIPMTIGGTNDVRVREVGSPVGGDVELCDPYVPVAVPAARDEVPIEMRVLDVAAVRGPVGVVVVDALPVERPGARWLHVGALGLLGAIDA